MTIEDSNRELLRLMETLNIKNEDVAEHLDIPFAVVKSWTRKNINHTVMQTSELRRLIQFIVKDDIH